MSDVDTLRSELATRDQHPPRMLPALAYTSDDVFAWEQRHVYAGTWTCLGRVDELLPSATEDRKAVLQRAVQVGDVPALLVRDGEVVAVDVDSLRLRLCELNLEVHQRRARVRLVEGDVLKMNLAGIDAVFIDPDRRVAGRRQISRPCRARGTGSRSV